MRQQNLNGAENKLRRIGILAFGSLISDPGPELKAVELKRIDVETPFPVEFARYSKKRAGAPTLVPVKTGGARVKAKILVLSSEVSREHVENMLWRRETGQVYSGKRYPRLRSRNAVRICVIESFAGVDIVLYTDFYAASKIKNPNSLNLARRSISSAKELNDGSDGITYLVNAMSSYIRTPLMEQYEREILRLTATNSLREALKKLQK